LDCWGALLEARRRKINMQSLSELSSSWLINYSVNSSIRVSLSRSALKGNQHKKERIIQHLFRKEGKQEPSQKYFWTVPNQDSCWMPRKSDYLWVSHFDSGSPDSKGRIPEQTSTYSMIYFWWFTWFIDTNHINALTILVRVAFFE